MPPIEKGYFIKRHVPSSQAWALGETAELGGDDLRIRQTFDLLGTGWKIDMYHA